MAASEILLVFSKKFRVKTGATVSSKYNIQQKKGISYNENPEAATIGGL